jgi:hypothetical protein
MAGVPAAVVEAVSAAQAPFLGRTEVASPRRVPVPIVCLDDVQARRRSDAAQERAAYHGCVPQLRGAMHEHGHEHVGGPVAEDTERPMVMPVFAGQKLIVVGDSSGIGRQTAADVVAAGGSAVLICSSTRPGSSSPALIYERFVPEGKLMAGCS